MISSSVRAAAVMFLCVALGAATALAGGLEASLPFYTIDWTGTLQRVPVSLDEAFDVVEAELISRGIPPADLEEIRGEVEVVFDEVEQTLEGLPLLLPIPLLGGGIEFSLPVPFISGLRLSGGVLNDLLIRRLAEVAGEPIPQPLFEATFDADTVSGSVSADAAFSTWMTSAEVVSRFDALFAAMSVAVGIDWIQGAIVPSVELDVPPDWAATASDALTALHLDELSWATFAVHGALGVEVGLPFLRVYGQVRFLLPVNERVGWWQLRAGRYAGALGMVIRF